MFRNIFRITRNAAIVSAVALTAAGCTEDIIDIDHPDTPESGYITLALNCTEGTRAPGDDTEDSNVSLNENLISSVTLCLWAKGGDKPDDTAKPDYVQTFTNLNSTQKAQLRVPITTALRNKLFETSGAECHAFVAVNVTPPAGEFTIAKLRNMAISSEFSSRRTQPSFAMDGDCVVSYDKNLNLATGNIDLQRSASKISLALNVDETVEQTVVINGTVKTSKWQPNTAAMRVSLVGGLAESTLDPNLENNPPQSAFFDTPDNLVYPFVANSDNGNNPPEIPNTDPSQKYTYPFIQERPFYTYPHRWSADPADYAATYMMLTIPWQEVHEVDGKLVPVDANAWRTCYYQVPVIAADSDPLQLVRNVAYHIYLHVGLLGSFIPDEPLLLEDLKYSAAPWGTVNMDVNIPDVRYLVVDQNDYTVNNETSIAIPFYTSHETIVTDATMTFYRYNYTDAGLEKTVTVSMAQNEESAKSTRAGAPVFTADFDNESKELKVKHDLDIYVAYDTNNNAISFTQNDGPTTGLRQPIQENNWERDVINRISYFKKQDPVEAEYSKVEFKITLQHKDMKGTPNFSEVITITQYPGMYIETTTNYYGSTNEAFNCTGGQGSTYINGNYTNLPSTSYHYLNGDNPNNNYAPSRYPSGYSKNDGWSTSIGLHSGGDYQNFNPNMYLITVTTLPEGTEYRIGDPRSKDINNYLGRSNSSDWNSPLPAGENKSVWAGTTYTYRHVSTNGTTTNVTTTADGFRSFKAIYPNENSRTLQYYYPTQEDDAHKMMIAPKIRVCSSYAGTSWVLNRELARRRAAAYQELGYAAGRWRLPTYGEVKFVMELAASYKIPRLFGTPDSPWWYWCANGLVTVPSKRSGQGPSIPDGSGYVAPAVSGTPDAQRARFVYDEWYWGEADLPQTGTIGSVTPAFTFTWGDKPINQE